MRYVSFWGLVLCAGCITSNPSEDDDPCEPGAVEACACSSEVSRICGEDERWGACDCPEPDGGSIWGGGGGSGGEPIAGGPAGGGGEPIGGGGPVGGGDEPVGGGGEPGGGGGGPIAGGGDEECQEGSLRRRPCEGSGEQERHCEGGVWGPWGPCVGGDACEEGEVMERPCGDGGAQVLICEGAAWVEGPCEGGEVEDPLCVEGDGGAPPVYPPLEVVELPLPPHGGALVEWSWSVIDRPELSTSQVTENRDFTNPIPDDPSTPIAYLFLDLAGAYTLELRGVTAEGIEVPSAHCQSPYHVILEAQPQAGNLFQLAWDTPSDPDQTDSEEGTDVDLHLLHPNGAGWHQAPLDCYYANPNPDWGAQGPANDPSLDIDDVNGAGPENINLEDPEEVGAYRIGVHYYSSSLRIGEPSLTSEVVLRVFSRGLLVGEWRRELHDRGDFWEPIHMSFSDGEIAITEVDLFTPGQ